MAARRSECFLGNIVFLQFTGGDGFVYPRQILIDNSAGPQIQMANLRVSHLAFRQTDVGATRTQLTSRIIAIELVVERRSCEKGGVTVLFCLCFAARINALAVANNEDYRPGHCALCRRLLSRTRSFTPCQV